MAMAAAERAEHVETLTAMGFPADAARAALQKYHSLAGATNALGASVVFEADYKDELHGADPTLATTHLGESSRVP